MTGAHTLSEQIARDLVLAVSPVFSDIDRDSAEESLMAGEWFDAADTAVEAAAREQLALPAELRARAYAAFVTDPDDELDQLFAEHLAALPQ